MTYLDDAANTAYGNINAMLGNMAANAASVYYPAAVNAGTRARTIGMKAAQKEAVESLGKTGIAAYTTSNGRNVPVDVGVRMHMNDAMRERQLSQTIDIATKTGVGLVEVSTTVNPRPSHQEWQGKVYQLVGSGKYQNYYEACHVGDPVNGIAGYNCGHTIALYHEGKQKVFADPLEGTGYTPEQARAVVSKQRALENGIRKAKRAKRLLESQGMDSSDVSKTISASQKQIREIVERYPFTRRARWREAVYNESMPRFTVSDIDSVARRLGFDNAEYVGKLDGGDVYKVAESKSGVPILIGLKSGNLHILGDDEAGRIER